MSKFNFIEEHAMKLLEQTSESSCPPINLDDKILSMYGIELHEENLEDEISGMLVIKENSKHIIVNATHSPKRKRFTIAHELGHLLLHHIDGEDKLFIDKKTYHRANKENLGTSYIEEREANKFASYLLMPRALMNSYIKQNFDENISEFDDYDISKIAAEFEVSDQAMMIRLKNLGYQVTDNY